MSGLVTKSKALKEYAGDVTCEAIGCDSKASVKLILNVGKNRVVHLFLCKDCRSKFSGRGNTITNSDIIHYKINQTN